MAVLELRSDDIQDENAIARAIDAIFEKSSGVTLIATEAIGTTERHLAKAGDHSAGQDLVLASTLAEGIRTFHTQVAGQLTSGTIRSQTQHLISSLFDEFTQLLQGLYLVGEVSEQGRTMLLSYGERTSAVIVAQTLKERSLEAEAVFARPIYLSQSPSVPKRIKERALADFRNEISGWLESGTLPVVPASLRSHWPEG